MLTSTPAQRGSAFQPAQRSPPRKPGMHVLRKHRTASTEPMVTPSPSFAHTRKIRPTTMARKPHSTCAEGVQRPEDPDLPLYGNPPADMSQPREQMQSRLQDRNPLHPKPAPSAGTPDSAFLDLASMSPFSTDAKVCATPANHLMQPQHSPVFATPKGIATRDPELPVRRQLYRDRPTCDCACICMVISGLCIVVLLCIGMQANGMLMCPT